MSEPTSRSADGILKGLSYLLSAAGFFFAALAAAGQGEHSVTLNFFLAGVIFLLSGMLLRTVLKLRSTVEKLTKEMSQRDQ